MRDGGIKPMAGPPHRGPEEPGATAPGAQQLPRRPGFQWGFGSCRLLPRNLGLRCCSEVELVVWRGPCPQMAWGSFPGRSSHCKAHVLGGPRWWLELLFYLLTFTQGHAWGKRRCERETPTVASHSRPDQESNRQPVRALTTEPSSRASGCFQSLFTTTASDSSPPQRPSPLPGGPATFRVGVQMAPDPHVHGTLCGYPCVWSVSFYGREYSMCGSTHLRFWCLKSPKSGVAAPPPHTPCVGGLPLAWLMPRLSWVSAR